MTISERVKSGVFGGMAWVERTLWGRGAATTPLGEVKNFLLLQYPSALGTAIHATPLIPALRAAVPGCRIAVAASGMALEIFRNNPGVDMLLETPNPLRDLTGAVRELRGFNPFCGEKFATLTSTGNERTKVALQSMLSGASLRVGFTVVPELYAMGLAFDFSRSQIANNLRIVEALGHEVQHFEPQVFFTDADAEFARQCLVEAGVDLVKPIAIFVTQTSVTQRKSWRPERFQAVAEFLHGRYGMQIVFVGTVGEAAKIDALRGGLGFPSVNVAGATNLMQLTAMLKMSDVGVTLDTGTMHLGRAVGLPMVIIAPAWSPPIEWLPLGDTRFAILKNLDMSAAPADYIIDEVSVSEVITALEDLMRRFPAGSTR